MEFALVLPLILVVALALVQTGLLVRDRLLVEAAAPSLEDGAIELAIDRTGVRGEPVTVSIRYAAPVRVPFVEWLFHDAVGMTASTTARQEFG